MQPGALFPNAKEPYQFLFLLWIIFHVVALHVQPGAVRFSHQPLRLMYALC